MLMVDSTDVPEQEHPPQREGGQSPHQQHVPYSAERHNALKRRIRIALWILLVIAVVLAIWGIASRLIERSELGKRTVQDSRLAVVTAKAQLSGAGDELVLPGVVQAYIEAAIYARTSGYLKNWYTDIGSRVKKGQLLADIETPEVDRQLAQARADLNTAQANLQLSRSTNERWKTLLATHSVSQQDADEKAGDTAAKDAMAKASEQNVARLEDLESFKRVLAPFDGVVTARNTDIGALINAGQATGTELFRVADTERLRIYAQVPEAYAASTTTGLIAELQFAEQPGKKYEAEAVRTSNALDPTARTLQVELQLDNQQGEVFPGAYAEVHFKLPSSSKSLRLPANTVVFRAAGMQVATVDNSGKIKLKNIQQGRDFGKTIEVLSGIDQNDVVVVNPPDSITDGLPVRIAPAPTAAAGAGSAGGQPPGQGGGGQSGNGSQPAAPQGSRNQGGGGE
jgi:RND family efflux transporter MFP subunit